MIVFTEIIVDVKMGYLTVALNDVGEVLYVKLADPNNIIYYVTLDELIDRYPTSEIAKKAKIFLRDMRIEDILKD